MVSSEPKNNLRAWREFRDFTQQELAAKVGTTAAVISLLENGQRGLSASWLKRLAPHLNVRPGFLLDHTPDDLTADILEAWANVPVENRSDALATLRGYSEKRTAS